MNNPKFVHQADERRSYMLNRMSERKLKAEIFKNHVVKTATSDINRFSQELIRTQKFRTLPSKIVSSLIWTSILIACFFFFFFRKAIFYH